jgi:PAS domain S-box-containing protein
MTTHTSNQTTALFERMVMEAQDAIILQTLDLIIPDKLQHRHWEGYHKVMQTGETRYGRELLAVPGLRKDGARISLEFSITILRDDAGAISGIAAILRDVTTRFEQDRALRQRVAGLEARIKDAGLPPVNA